MNTDASANELPLLFLFLSGVQKPRKPYQGDRHYSTVVQHNRQCIVGTRHINCYSFTAGH